MIGLSYNSVPFSGSRRHLSADSGKGMSRAIFSLLLAHAPDAPMWISTGEEGKMPRYLPFDILFMTYICIIALGFACGTTATAATIGESQRNDVKTLENVTVSDVLGAWRNREARIRSARFEWDEKVTRPKGSMSYYGPEKIMPPEDMTTDRHAALVFEGTDKVRYETDGQTWSLINNQLVNQHYQVVDNNKMEKKLFDMKGATDNLLGQVKHSPMKARSQTTHTLPILLHCRSSHQSMVSLTPSMWHISKIRPNDQRSHVRMETYPYPYGIKTEMDIDVNRDYIVTRLDMSQNGHLGFRADIKYEMQEGEWMPSSWSASMLGRKGTVREACIATSVRGNLNPSLRAGEFDLEFPVGTIVTESDSQSSATKRYILLANGKEQPIDETGMPDIAGRKLPVRLGAIKLMIIISSLAVLAFFVFIRRRTKESASQQ